MGHIGLTPQAVNEQGGYYTHGKNDQSAQRLIQTAKDLQIAGCFAVVLECIEESVSATITKNIHIPTIGIGAGKQVDGQVLVLNDLLKLGSDYPPSFCKPIINLFDIKKEAIQKYLEQNHA